MKNILTIVIICVIIYLLFFIDNMETFGVGYPYYMRPIWPYLWYGYYYSGCTEDPFGGKYCYSDPYVL